VATGEKRIIPDSAWLKKVKREQRGKGGVEDGTVLWGEEGKEGEKKGSEQTASSETSLETHTERRVGTNKRETVRKWAFGGGGDSRRLMAGEAETEKGVQKNKTSRGGMATKQEQKPKEKDLGKKF